MALEDLVSVVFTPQEITDVSPQQLTLLLL